MADRTFFTDQKELYFNGEAVQMLHDAKRPHRRRPIVFFRKSDVIVAGDVLVTTTFPTRQPGAGGASTASSRQLNTSSTSRCRRTNRRGHLRIPATAA